MAAPSNTVDRATARRISIFNHKGGVGKTTLTVNLGAALAAKGRRVLLVDTDPQCNLTSYLVAADVVDDLLDSSDGDDGQTVWSAVKPISEATGAVGSIKPIELAIDNMYLVPGDIRLSEFEVDLGDFWAQCLQRKARGFRGTTAISDMVNQLCLDHEIDYVLYDSGPNIGSLNRVVLLDCDYFVVPVACDLFSLRALKTLGKTLSDWISSWETIGDLAPDGTSLLPGRPAFLGYIPEGFRIYNGEVIVEQASFLRQIEREILAQIVTVLRRLDPLLVSSPKKNYRLGEVKHFGRLVPASQRAGVPIYSADIGLPHERATAKLVFTRIAKVIDEALWEAD